MTLITHIWTSKLNIIAAEGRVVKQGTKELINENRKKIFAKDNFFIAFHGVCDFNGNSIPRIIHSFIQNCESSNPEVVAIELKQHLTSLNLNLQTSFIVGGQYEGKVYSLYFTINAMQLYRDDLAMEHGYRYNSENKEHAEEIGEIMKSSFRNTFHREFTMDASFDSFSNEQLTHFLTEFYNQVSTSANKSFGIGPNADIGIVRDNKFHWLINTNNQLDI